MASSFRDTKTPHTISIIHYENGIRMPKSIPAGPITWFTEDTLKSALAYEPRENDIFIVSFQKCGCTWTQTILYLMLHEGQPPAEGQHIPIPYMEAMGMEVGEQMLANEKTRVLKTHLAAQHVPWSKHAKYIYVVRNPKDVVVSFYHHTKTLPAYEFTDGTFDDYFELFMNEQVDGDYFEHLLSWEKKRQDPENTNILLLMYEEMKQDPKAAVLQIAEFLGIRDQMEADNNKVLDAVLQHSSFKSMKEDKFTWEALTRKGVVGDWRNVLSEEQSKHLDEKFAKLTKGTSWEGKWSAELAAELAQTKSEAATTSTKTPPCTIPLNHYKNGIRTPQTSKHGPIMWFTEDTLKSAMAYKPQENDVIIVSYPKCGCTWTQTILYLMTHDGQPPADGQSIPCVFMEGTGMEVGEQILANENTRIFKTHLYAQHVPWNKHAKYVYVVRNPKDVVVSFYHHTTTLPAYEFTDGRFDDYYELFMNEQVDGDYFDHLLSWEKKRQDPENTNILSLTYEDMKQDPRAAVLQMAEFLGIRDQVEADNNKVLDAVLNHSSFKNMKEDKFTWEVLTRKGVVGDWRNVLSEEQSNRLDEKFEKLTKGTSWEGKWSVELAVNRVE